MTAARLSFIAAVVGIVSVLLLTKHVKFIILIAVLVAVALIYPSQLRDRFFSTITVNVLHKGERYTAQTQDQRIRQGINIPTLPIKIATGSADNAPFATSSGQTATDITPGEPIDTTQLGVYRSFEIRLNLEWPRALNAFYQNPLLGTGYSSLGLATDNDILRTLGEVGLLGLLSFSLIFLETAKSIIRIYRGSGRFIKFFSAGILSVMLAFVVNSLFIDVFEASKVATVFWLLLGTNLAVEKFS